MPIERPSHVYVTYIRATPEQIWQALTSPDFTRRYFHETAVESDWKPGSRVTYRLPDGSSAADGEVLECDPPRLLSYTWSAHWSPEFSQEKPSRVTWEIEPQGARCKLTVVHDRFDGETLTFKAVSQGWSEIICSLKTLLETGEPLPAGQA